MSQITITNCQNQVIEAYIVSEDLYRKLDSVASASSLDCFTVELLEELRLKFLETVIVKFNLHDQTKNTVWHLNKANFYAHHLFPWYNDFMALYNSVERLPVSESELIIQLTSL